MPKGVKARFMFFFRFLQGNRKLFDFILLFVRYPKGHIISKVLFGVFKSTKKARNFCKDFCPRLKKRLKKSM
jgi:hypothetical protein